MEHLSLLSQKTTVLPSAKSKSVSRPKGKRRNEGSASARIRSERRRNRNNAQRLPQQRQRLIGSGVKRRKLPPLPKQNVGSVRRPQSVLNRRQKGDRARRRRCRPQPMLNVLFDIFIHSVVLRPHKQNPESRPLAPDAAQAMLTRVSVSR